MTRRISKHISLANKIRAVGHPIRLAVISLLSEEPMEFGHLVKKLNISPSLLAHHLQMLLAAQWISKSKYGKTVIFTRDSRGRRELMKFLGSLQTESN